MVLIGVDHRRQDTGRESKKTERRIYRILSSHSAGRVMDEYWYLRLDGKDDEAKKLLTDLAAKGIPIP